jgi:hypothetical protein
LLGIEGVAVCVSARPPTSSDVLNRENAGHAVRLVRNRKLQLKAIREIGLFSKSIASKAGDIFP